MYLLLRLFFTAAAAAVDSQILRSLILRRLCKLNSILIVIKLNARLFICCFVRNEIRIQRTNAAFRTPAAVHTI